MPDRPQTFGRRRSLATKAETPAAPAPSERTRALGRLAADEGATEAERSSALEHVKRNTVASSATAGWAAVDKVSEAMSDYAAFLKITDTPTILKVIDAAPIDVFVCHWVDEIEDGAKSIRCLEKGCPLCDIGDKAKKFSACFNVISLADPEDAVLKVWECGVKIARQLRDIASDEKRGPLDRADLYFSIYKTQKGQKSVEYHLERVRARDLEDEYGIKPLSDAEITQFLSERYTDAVKDTLSVDAMQEIVDMIMNGA